MDLATESDMMRGIVFTALLLAFSLSHSPSEAEGYEEKSAEFAKGLNANIGYDINTVIRRIGPPSSQFKMPNGHMLWTFFRAFGDSSCTTNFEADDQNKIVFTSFIGCVF